MYIYISIYCEASIFDQAHKKHSIISVNCRRPARTLRTGRRPDHGTKNGATNLFAGLLNLEMWPPVGPESGLFWGSQNTHGSYNIKVRIGKKERDAGTCAAANAGRPVIHEGTPCRRLKNASLRGPFPERVSCAIASAGQTHSKETANYR